jgi:hypothetical protein
MLSFKLIALRECLASKCFTVAEELQKNSSKDVKLDFYAKFKIYAWSSSACAAVPRATTLISIIGGRMRSLLST